MKIYKRNLILFVLLICAVSGKSQVLSPRWGDQGNGTYINPILNADYSDPDVIRVGNKYYMVASDFHFLGMQVLESNDMVNWKLVSQIYHRFDFPGWNDNQQYAGGSWAPAIRYHNNKFWVFFCTPKEGLFMSSAEHAEGPWTPLCLVKKVENWEDPCPFWDDDGQMYLGRSKKGAGPIIIHKMSADGMHLLDDGVTVYTGPVAEGTKIFKRNGFYYISIPEGGVERGWQTVLRAKNLYGPYMRKIVLEQGSTFVNGPHQGAMVDTPEGKWMFFHFQHSGSLGRVVYLEPMYWKNDWPSIGVDQDMNGIGEPVSVWEKPIQGEAPSVPQTDDDFSSQNLLLQWQFNHNPVDRAWSLTDHPGSLTLYALKSTSFRLAHNTLTQKVMGYVSEATLTIDVSGMKRGQRCGLACMGKQNELLGIKMDGDKRMLYLSNDTIEKNITSFAGSILYLRVSINIPNHSFQYSYSFDNITFSPCGKPFYINFGYWKGARIALYCYNKDSEAGYASFLRFDYKHDGPQNSSNNKMEQIIKNIARTSFPCNNIYVAASSNPHKHTSLKQLQHAIDSCSQSGGGRVIVAKGIYHLDGSLILKSNVDLYLQEGACLLFSGYPSDFLPVVPTRWEGIDMFGHSPMIYAYHASNVAITGKGLIDAQAGLEFAGWSEREVHDRDCLRQMGDRQVPLWKRIFGKGTMLRPSCVQFYGCSRIYVEGITIKNSPFWTIHPLYCDNVIVRGVTIDSHYPNNDGCDPESTSNVLIENCIFKTGDDAIAIKSGRDCSGREIGRMSSNIVIRNCIFNSECNGLCIGSEISGGVENVYMDKIRIGKVKNALYFKSNRDRGGYIRNVWVSNVHVDHTQGAILRFETNYFGFRGGHYASQYENFHIRNIIADNTDHYAIFMDGYEEKPIRNIVIDNFHVAKAQNPYYFKCIKNILLKNSTINGEKILEVPKENKRHITLDVY
jgi:xylan 1,4-beta-xylosidase